MSEDKIKIPSREEKRIKFLETENADLWYENIVFQGKINSQEKEIADLWYEALVSAQMEVR